MSDLHFKNENQSKWNADIVLKALYEDIIKCQREFQLNLDLILVSGDISFSSQPDEYRLAQAFFSDLLIATKVNHKERLFIVPGNHDVNWNKITGVSELIISSVSKRENVEKLLIDESGRKLILTKFEDYINFIRDFFQDTSHIENDFYFFVRSEEIDGQKLAILGLNSAWAVGKANSNEKIVLGEWSVRNALDKVKSADLYIALMHHPFECMYDFDSEACSDLLMQKNAIILRGHKHRSAIEERQTPSGKILTIAAGASYESRKDRNGYNFVMLNLANKRFTIFPRIWSNSGSGFWTEDNISFRNIDDGRYDFNFDLHTLRKYKNKSLQADDDIQIENIPLGKSWSYNYAQNAVQRNLMPGDVIKELPKHLVKEVLVQMNQLYLHNDATLYSRFLKELLNVK